MGETWSHGREERTNGHGRRNGGRLAGLPVIASPTFAPISTALIHVIVPLLCERHHFVTEAAKFKPSVAGVVVPSRVEEIVAPVRDMAAARR